MDVLLTHGYFIHEDEKEGNIMKPYPPLGILYLSAYLKQHQIKTEVFDSTFSSFNQLIANIEENKPRVLAIYTNLVTKLNVLKIINYLKNHPDFSQLPIVLGGPDVTYNYKNYLNAGADYVIIGEGEQTMHELTLCLIENKPLNEVTGIAYKQQDKFIKTPERVKIKQIDELPIPDRQGINLNAYLDVWKKHHGSSTISISTQRGCPYTCKWCSTAVYGQSYRRRSPHLVTDEIEELIKIYNPDSLWFVDDVFTVSHKWISELHQAFKTRNIKIKFECITRAERLNDKVLSMLKEMGCQKIWIGAESGSQKIIDKMDRRVDVVKVQEMIIKAQKIGIDAGTFIMVGYPDETFKDIKATVNHLKKSLPEQFTITVTYPIAGTSLYEEIKSNITTNLDWTRSTDRDIRFKRNYSDKYYQYAVRYIVNSVEAYRQIKQKKNYLSGLKLKTKAVVSRLIMTVV